MTATTSPACVDGPTGSPNSSRRAAPVSSTPIWPYADTSPPRSTPNNSAPPSPCAPTWPPSSPESTTCSGPGSTPTRWPVTWRRCSPRSPHRAPAWRPSPSPTSRGSPRLPGRSDLAPSPSTTASAPRPSATGSSSPKPPTTRSSPTHGCGARIGSTPVPSGTNGSPPPSPTRCDCPAAATPGPTPAFAGGHLLRMARRGRRTALGRHLPRPLARQAPARTLLRRRPHGQTPASPSPPGSPRGSGIDQPGKRPANGPRLP